MKYLLLSLLASVALFGCSDHSRRGDPTGYHNDQPTAHQVDPVSGAPVRSDSAWTSYWHGDWFYFESEDNRRKFDADPTAYVTDDGRAQQKRKVTPSEVR